jgi:hypothetical protein
MSWKRIRSLLFIILVYCLAISLERHPMAQGAVNSIASPVQAGCYRVQPSTCKIHVEPFTLNLTSGKKLVLFQLAITQAGTTTQRIIYDFRPDVSNPVPFSGNTYTPSMVSKDFAATCGKSYSLSLISQDTGDGSPLVLGTTNVFSCPVGSYFIPIITK